MTIPPRHIIAHTVALLGYFLLFATLVAWNAWISPPSELPRLLPLLALGLPLLAVLRGLLHGRRRSCQASCLLALVYLALGISSVGGGALVPGLVETFASLAWFTGTAVYLKYAP